MQIWNKVKITVLKKMFLEDLVAEYLSQEMKEAGFGPCSAVQVGQEFILSEPNMPQGFCSWAWADLHRDVIAMMTGSEFRWHDPKSVALTCCTDAVRPVVFKIERVD